MWCLVSLQNLQNFYPRPPRGGRRSGDELERYIQIISIHALREEGDGKFICLALLNQLISIHALREEGDVLNEDIKIIRVIISIHALREEGDKNGIIIQCVNRISIHALREEGDSHCRLSCMARL